MITGLIFILVCLVLAAGGLAIWSRVTLFGIEQRFEREGRDVTVDGGVLNILEYGDLRSDGPTIVLLHGTGKNLKDLKVSLGDRLASDRRVILVDRPGHGWSDRLDREDIDTPEGQAIALYDALGRLGVERPLIVGHCWGGALALSYALSYPEEVAGLVVIAPHSHPERRTPSLLDRVGASRVGGWIAGNMLSAALGPMTQRSGLKRDFSPQTVPADYSEAVAAPLALRPGAFCSNAEDIVALGPFLEDQSIYYGQITVPLVVITGDEDAVTKPGSHAEKLASSVPGARLVLLNDVGHMPHHSSPNVIAFEVNRLADRL